MLRYAAILLLYFTFASWDLAAAQETGVPVPLRQQPQKEQADGEVKKQDSEPSPIELKAVRIVFKKATGADTATIPDPTQLQSVRIEIITAKPSDTGTSGEQSDDWVDVPRRILGEAEVKSATDWKQAISTGVEVNLKRAVPEPKSDSLKLRVHLEGGEHQPFWDEDFNLGVTGIATDNLESMLVPMRGFDKPDDFGAVLQWNFFKLSDIHSTTGARVKLFKVWIADYPAENDLVLELLHDARMMASTTISQAWQRNAAHDEFEGFPLRPGRNINEGDAQYLILRINRKDKERFETCVTVTANSDSSPQVRSIVVANQPGKTAAAIIKQLEMERERLKPSDQGNTHNDVNEAPHIDADRTAHDDNEQKNEQRMKEIEAELNTMRHMEEEAPPTALYWRLQAID